MHNIPTDPKAVLEIAIANEIEGHRILSDAMEATEDPRAKAAFQFLANQEIEHIDLIKQFAASLETGEPWEPPTLEDLTPEQVRERIRGIFERFRIQFEDAGVMPDAHLEAYKVAMEMEGRGYEFYHAAAQQTTDSNAKKLYEFLAKEEQRHFEILQDTHDYLNNPEGVLAWEERWMQT